MTVGSVAADLLPLLRIHEGDTLITKDGDPIAVIALEGLDYEGMSDEAREAHVHHIATVLRTIDTRTRVYAYLTKFRSGEWHGRPTYTVAVHLALVVDAKARASGGWFTRRATLIATSIARAVATLNEQVRLVTSRLEAFGPTVLDRAAAFAVLARLVNGPATTSRLLRDDDLDDQLADVPIEVDPLGLTIGGVPVQVLTMKTLPRTTYPLMLHELYALDGELVCCLTWQRIDAITMKKDIARRLMNNHNYPAVWVEAENAQLAGAEKAMAMDGHAFGDCSITLAVRGDSADRLAADAQRILSTHDGAFVREAYHAVYAWAGMLPGNHTMSLYRYPLRDVNAADLALLFGVVATVHRPITTFRTLQGTALPFGFHVQDVGHTLVLGAPGSGKTTTLCVLGDAAWRTEQPRIVVFDLGKGYRDLAHRLGGRVASFTDGQLPALNPFAGEPTADHLFFLQAFCTVLAEGMDGTRLTDAQREDLYDQIVNLYVLDKRMHRLGQLVPTLTPDLQARFRPWVGDGMYAKVFDHASDDLTLADVQVFEFDGLEDHPALLAPLLFYVLHRVNVRVSVERMTLCLMDEAWRFLAHPLLREYVKAALKTWRKHNGVMVLASQALEDFAAADLLQTAVESCPTVLLLANPLRDRARYKTTFDLNDRELAMLADLRRGQVMLKRPGISKVFEVVPLEVIA